MKRWLLSLLSMLLVPSFAFGQGPDCAKSEAACLLDAAWSATLNLPLEKQTRLMPAFLEIASLSGEPSVLSFWENRFDQKLAASRNYPDYGWEKAEPIIQQRGIDVLIEIASQRRDPLSFGRGDVLLSAGKHYVSTDPIIATRLNDVLLDLSTQASAFERPSLAHAAAELAMVRCDADRLSRAISRTDAPSSLRYAFWRARLSGGVRDLFDKVRAVNNDEDTRYVRRVLDGYRAILEFGYCRETKAMGG